MLRKLLPRGQNLGERRGPVHEEIFGKPTSKRRYRARRRFFNRACRIFRAFRLGLEIAKVTLPTLRTFQPFPSGSLLLVSILETSQLRTSPYLEYHESRGNAEATRVHKAYSPREDTRGGRQEEICWLSPPVRNSRWLPSTGDSCAGTSTSSCCERPSNGENKACRLGLRAGPTGAARAGARTVPSPAPKHQSPPLTCQGAGGRCAGTAVRSRSRVGTNAGCC
jgi:hypothetical protein